HPCAEMAVRCEAAAGQTFFAAMTIDKLLRWEEMSDALFQASAAKLVAAEAAFWNGRHDIQIHGGMGFSAENDSHLYVKRAHVLSRVFGDRNHLLADIIAAAPAQ
ncbi:MAG: acyl-CoA dehydrogenase family protein, partial [Acidimicrobiia bacterium]